MQLEGEGVSNYFAEERAKVSPKVIQEELTSASSTTAALVHGHMNVGSVGELHCIGNFLLQMRQRGGRSQVALQLLGAHLGR